MKGILFKPDMNLAIRETRKTVTRRLLNPQPVVECGILRWKPRADTDINIRDHADLAREFTRYFPGETVYVKEACWVTEPSDGDVYFKLDGDNHLHLPLAMMVANSKWKSPMFMPEKYARTFLKILDVLPEPLYFMSDYEAQLEGVHTGVLGYVELWDSINKKNLWASNPWVWKYTFEVEA